MKNDRGVCRRASLPDRHSEAIRALAGYFASWRLALTAGRGFLSAAATMFVLNFINPYVGGRIL